MNDPVKNFVRCVVSGVYSSADTAIVLQSGEGAKMSQPSGDGAFDVTWYNSTDYPNASDDPYKEIVRVTARTSDALTVTRAQQSTTASAKNVSGKVYLMILTPSKKTADDTLSSTGGTLTGAIDLGENAGLALDTVLSADGKYSGITEEGVLGETVVFGELCYLKAADSRWWKTDANVAATAGDVKIGICVIAGAATGTTKILLWGKVNAASLFPPLTVSAPVYIGETAGTIVVTQPVTADVIIRKIGFGNTADELFFCPDSIYVTHS